MSFWPTQEHWSVAIPLVTDHYRMPVLAADGFVELRPMPVDVPASEWESVEYMDWKSGGDTNFAPLASADGELDCRGFWDKGKTDKDALWTSNAERTPTLKAYVDAVGANFGRVRLIKLEPQDRELLLLRGLEGLPYEQAARQLGIAAPAARKRWERLRGRLASLWPMLADETT